MRRLKFAVIAVLLVASVSGCASFWHDLQPHRLRRLNRGPAPSLDPEFSSVSQPLGPAIVANSDQNVTVRAQQ
ncbi:MAG: hypothetical protein SH850_22645 [Planctomycetaceae bacterium]|nr:hypothetical protein [Planctomycetaceae bacterium]